jgi:hypothetical protein
MNNSVFQPATYKRVAVVVLGVIIGVIIVTSLSNIVSKAEFSQNLDDINRISLNTNAVDDLFAKRQYFMDQLKIIDQKLERISSSHGPSFFPSSVVSKQAAFLEDPITLASLPDNPTLICKYRFKVYVYPIPTVLPAVQIGEEARRNGTLHVCRKCILEQFALEFIIYDFFLSFCGRTYDPTEADYFYLPLIRDAEFRMAMQLGGIRSRAPSLAEQALIAVLEKNDSSLWNKVFNITDHYWHRKGGSDHIIVMPAPVTNLRHETSKRGFFHYMSHLKPPIFLSIEYSKSFVTEYPICATQKNILSPYPTTDPDLFNGKLLAFHEIPRNYLIYYAGGLHGDCIEIRKAMRHLMINSTHFSKVIPPVKSNMVEREHGFLAATFCPVPVGDSPSSKRMYDVLNFGCIPVVLSDDLVWAFSDQTAGHLNHSTFSIQLPQSLVQYTLEHSLRRYETHPNDFGGSLPVSGLSFYSLLLQSKEKDNDYENGFYLNPLVRVLRRIPQEDVDFYREKGKSAAEHYRYYRMNSTMSHIPTSSHYFPDGGAVDVIAGQLEAKLSSLHQIKKECEKELLQKHKYVYRFPCESDKAESLVRK